MSDVRNKERRITNSFSSNFVNDDSNLEDLSKTLDCSLKITICNKLAKISSRNERKVSISPSTPDNNHVSEKKHEEIKNSPGLNNSIGSRSSLTFSKKKILLENEIQRKENVKKIIEQKRKEMQTVTQNNHDKLAKILSKKAAEKAKESAENFARMKEKEEKLALQDERDRKNKFEQQRWEESENLMKKIKPFQANFNARMQDISNESKNCKNKAAASQLLNDYSSSLKDLHTQMEIINTKAQRGDLTPYDVNLAEMLAACNEEVFQVFKANISQIEALYDEEIARREMELKQAELEAQREALILKQLEEEQLKLEQQIEASKKIQSQQDSQVDGTVSAQPPPYPSVPDAVTSSVEAISSENENVSLGYPDLESLKIYIDSQNFLQEYKLKFDNFIKSDTMKKFKFEAQKTINLPINAISHVSREQLIDKYDKLKTFLSGKGSPNILLNPEAEAFSKHLLAKKIVDQGITTISSKPELAYPFAAIAVAIWNDWPDFGQLLLAHFHAFSPFFVPIFLGPMPEQSDEDYYKSLGCKYNEDGTPEEPEQFLKRLGGTMYLYASILVTKQRQGVNKPHPHGIGNAWRWLAATLNIEPRSEIADICATLIYIILEVTGNDLWKTYPKQFPKMLQVLDQVYYAKLKSFNTVRSAPISRLGDFLASALQKGSIPAPKKQLPPNFW